MATDKQAFFSKLKINNRIIILKKDLLKSNIKFVKPAYKEDLIFETDKCEYIQGDYQKVQIVNQLYTTNNASRTIAKCVTNSGLVYERTSDDLVNLIGQHNYDTVFGSLCSVINQELKIRGILSLLTVPNKNRINVSCQVDNSEFEKEDKIKINECKDRVNLKQKSRRRRQILTPYVVKDIIDTTVKKVVVAPKDFQKILNSSTVEYGQSLKQEDKLPELGKVFDDTSNDSIGNLSALSVATTRELLKNPSQLLENIDRHTKIFNEDNDTKLTFPPNQPLSTPCISPSLVSENVFLSDSKYILTKLIPEDRMKFLAKQVSFDMKQCFSHDNDGYLPIHNAVLNNDLDLLRRQCIVLKIKDESVDIPGPGSVTPLKLSLYQENSETTAMLLRFGASPLTTDAEHRTPFHIASEMDGDHLLALVNYCKLNHRKILLEEELWKPEYETRSDEELTKYLFNYIGKMFDDQGYTPLMLASKMGKYANVRLLAECAPTSINTQMPNSGNTALYLAVGASGMDSIENGNKTKVSDHFRNTIEVLLDYGSDPSILNFSNSGVNDLVTEFTCQELSLLIANKLTSINFMSGDSLMAKNFDSFMLVKSEDGNINLKGVSNKKSKPHIVSNELLTAESSSDNRKSKKQLTDKGKSIVKNFTLNEPVVIKTEIRENKRKLEICIEPGATVKKRNVEQNT